MQSIPPVCGPSPPRNNMTEAPARQCGLELQRFQHLQSWFQCLETLVKRAFKGFHHHGLLTARRKENAGCCKQGSRISKGSSLGGSKSVLLHHVTRPDLQQANATQQCPTSASDGASVRSPQMGQAGSRSLAGGEIIPRCPCRTLPTS